MLLTASRDTSSRSELAPKRPRSHESDFDTFEYWILAGRFRTFWLGSKENEAQKGLALGSGQT